MPAKQHFFQRYINPVFIETGSGGGDGIQLAIDAGFAHIYSIELAKYFYDLCVDSFREYSNVHLLFGDSRYVLESLLETIDVPITFWLDAHCSGGLTEGRGIPYLMEEIDIIGRHHIKSHTVLIDDLQHWSWNDKLMEKLLLINSDYVFTIEDGSMTKEDILVAEVRN